MPVLFPPDAKRLGVPVLIVGPRQSHTFNFTLDTGAAVTVAPAVALRQLGVDLSRPIDYTTLRGTAGVAVRTPLVRVPAISALGRVRTNFIVAAHDFPIGAATDGLLGLDFLRGFVLRIDFIRGRISLLAKRWWQFWR